MKLYKIIYCFVDEKGIINANENGDIIYTFLAVARNENEALGIMFSQEKFVSMPDILGVEEVQEVWKY